MTKPTTAAAAAKWLGERFGRLDVLVNNAGVGFEFATGIKPSQLTMEMLRTTYETNFFGVFAVILATGTRSFRPRIASRAPGSVFWTV